MIKAGLVLLLAVAGAAVAVTPRITWTVDPSIPKSMAPGESTTHTVTLKNTGYLPILAAYQLRIDVEGDIADYVTFAQPTFPNPFKRNAAVTFNLTVSVPKGTPDGTVGGSLVLKRVIRNKVVDVWRAEALAVSVTVAPVLTVSWSPGSLSLSVAAGTANSANVDLSVTHDISDVDVSVAPELTPFVSVYPQHFASLTAGETYPVSIWVSVPANTPLGSYDGTIQLRQGTRTLAMPLPIVLDVTPLTSVDDPTELATPSSDRIIEDTSSGITLARDEVMITLGSPVASSEAHSVAALLGGQVIGGLPELHRYQIRVGVTDIDELASLIEFSHTIPGVIAAHGHYFGYEHVLPDDGTFTPLGDTITCLDFDEPTFWDENNPGGCNWGHELVRLPSAWDLATGRSSTKVGVIDTGFFTDSQAPYYHYDFYDPAMVASNVATVIPFAKVNDARSQEHGTHVAGIIAAKGNNDEGITGVMWDANLNVCTTGVWDGNKVAYDLELIHHCAAHLAIDDVRVINISLGMDGNCKVQPGKLCLNLADNWGHIFETHSDVLFVVSAGNCTEDGKPIVCTESAEELGFYGTSYRLPAALADDYPNVIAVVSVERQAFELAADSVYGTPVTIAAPGSPVYSLSSAKDSLGDARQYVGMRGTSMAAPFVSGVAGLMLSVNEALTAPELKRLLEEGAKNGGQSVTSPDNDLIYVLNAYESVLLAEAEPPSTAFAKDDAVQIDPDASQSTAVWDNPTGSVIGTQAPGARGTVISGPSYARGTWYWQVDFESGVDGWVAGEFLREAQAPPPTASLTAEPASIVSGHSATLTWSSTNATGCVGTGIGFDTNDEPSGATSVSPAVATEYGVTCTGAGGTASDSVTVTVTTPVCDRNAPFVPCSYGGHDYDTMIADDRWTSSGEGVIAFYNAAWVTSSSTEDYVLLDWQGPGAGLLLPIRYSGGALATFDTLQVRKPVQHWEGAGAPPGACDGANPFVPCYSASFAADTYIKGSSWLGYDWGIFYNSNVARVYADAATTWRVETYLLDGSQHIDLWQGTSHYGEAYGVSFYSPALEWFGVGSGNLPSKNFLIGTGVDVTADAVPSVNVRDTANGNIIGTQLPGAGGTVIGGPEWKGEYWWWKVDFESGADGWVAEQFLRKADVKLVWDNTALGLQSSGGLYNLGEMHDHNEVGVRVSASTALTFDAAELAINSSASVQQCFRVDVYSGNVLQVDLPQAISVSNVVCVDNGLSVPLWVEFPEPVTVTAGQEVTLVLHATNLVYGENNVSAVMRYTGASGEEWSWYNNGAFYSHGIGYELQVKLYGNSAVDERVLEDFESLAIGPIAGQSSRAGTWTADNEYWEVATTQAKGRQAVVYTSNPPASNANSGHLALAKDAVSITGTTTWGFSFYSDCSEGAETRNGFNRYALGRTTWSAGVMVKCVSDVEIAVKKINDPDITYIDGIAASTWHDLVISGNPHDGNIEISVDGASALAGEAPYPVDNEQWVTMDGGTIETANRYYVDNLWVGSPYLQ